MSRTYGGIADSVRTYGIAYQSEVSACRRLSMRAVKGMWYFCKRRQLEYRVLKTAVE